MEIIAGIVSDRETAPHGISMLADGSTRSERAVAERGERPERYRPRQTTAPGPMGRTPAMESA
ncbi:hypothetical protein ACFXEL_22320 [Streptomyces sp. NPDC059382]|uniref:hypothetical protein n=1 Tax=Streptomyces sp. NPDC059382 TaxID=3346816 RepID=UPI00368FC4A0